MDRNTLKYEINKHDTKSQLIAGFSFAETRHVLEQNQWFHYTKNLFRLWPYLHASLYQSKWSSFSCLHGNDRILMRILDLIQHPKFKIQLDSIMFGSNTMLIRHLRQDMPSNGLNTIGVRIAVLKTTVNTTIMKNMMKISYKSGSLLPRNMSPMVHHQHGFILKMHTKDCIWLISQSIMRNPRRI